MMSRDPQSGAMGADPDQVRRWMLNWHKMSAAFGVTSGVNVLILLYSSSILGENNNLGFIGPALLNASWLLSSMLFSSQVCLALGSKRAMLLGVLMADTFYVAFTIAAGMEDGWLKTFLVVFGNILSGTGAGLFWTAEGAYFARSAELVAEASGGKLEDHTNLMSGIFAAWNFIPEVLLKLTVAAIQNYGAPRWVSMGSACASALGMTVFMVIQMETLPDDKPRGQARKCLSVTSLWGDPCVWLLSFMNVTFGFASGLLNGKINSDFTKEQLGVQFVGLLGAGLSFVALAAQWPYELMVQRFGKLSVMWCGAACFTAMACGTLFLDLSSLGYWLVSFYVLHGLGRAAYESTNRAIFADFFPPPKSEDAFANVTMQQAIAFTSSFLLQIVFDVDEMADSLLVLALLIMPGVYVAFCIRARHASIKEPVLVEVS